MVLRGSMEDGIEVGESVVFGGDRVSGCIRVDFAVDS
jgi:hypothetical protein